VNDTGRLMTKFDVPAVPNVNCFSFYFHMYGKQVERLSLIKSISPNETVLWTRRGNQGNAWLLGRVSIKSDEDYKLIFESVRGSGSTVCFKSLF
jgi:hypothetical protein